MIGEGQIERLKDQFERLKDQFKETIALVSEMTEVRSKDAADAVRTKLGDETRRANR